MCGLRLIRLQCYEGLDEAKALYEWDYRKQLLHLQAAAAADEDALFSERYLLARPLLEAIRALDPVVLLVDEVDRLDFETEALLLEVLSDYAVSIPELGTVTARSTPLVFLTSNGSRDLSEPLRRRCLYLHLDYPSVEREREIVLEKVPGVPPALAGQVAQLVRTLRLLDLKKRPSVSETLDWANALTLMGVTEVTPAVIEETAPVLLKHHADVVTALEELSP
jgi:MoxR-like ATPase